MTILSTLRAAIRNSRFDHFEWYGDEDRAALINVNSGEVVGLYRHDGHGKWDMFLCVPYWKAWTILRSQIAGLNGFARMPKCWLWVFRTKSHAGAIACIEQLTGRQGMLPGCCIIERDEHDES